MLVPAGILVLVALGAIAVDSSIAFMAQRELENQATAAANDAVAVAVPADGIAQHGSDAGVDISVVEALIRSRFREQPLSRLEVTQVDRPLVVEGELIIGVHGKVEYLFAKAIPGARHTQTINVSAAAELR